MKNSKVLLLLSTVFPILLLSAEPSAFGAGDLNSQTPYGLTSNEKVILDTKNRLRKVSVKSNNQGNQLDSLRERIDGLQSIIESLSRKAHNNKINLNRQLQENEKYTQNNSEYENRLSEILKANELAISQQKIVINEMSKLIDVINAQYVSKEEFNTLVNDVNNFKDLIAKELGTRNKKAATSKFKSKSSATIATEAKAFYKKKYYTKAIESYEYLIKKNYKSAYAHYMIGDMNFKRKNYSNAISYYKKSSSLYSKASYMPKLMLNTAISMSKTGDEAHADAFFNAVVSKYPSSAEAEKASEYIQQ